MAGETLEWKSVVALLTLCRRGNGALHRFRDRRFGVGSIGYSQSRDSLQTSSGTSSRRIDYSLGPAPVELNKAEIDKHGYRASIPKISRS